MPTRVLAFPEEHSVGYLYLLDSFGEVYRHEYGINTGSARGILEIDVPPGQILQLTLTDGKLEHLEKLSSDSLDSLIISRYQTSLVDGSELRHLKHLTGLRELYLDSSKVGDEEIGYLSDLSNLEILSLHRASITDRSLIQIARFCPRLKQLYLSECRISDDGLAAITLLPLQNLDLCGTKITDVGLSHLAGLQSLNRLMLSQTAITGSGFAYLSGMQGLRTLVASETPISNDSIAHLRNNKALESVNLFKCENLTDAVVDELSELTAKEITLVACHLSPSAVERLKKSLPESRIWSDE